MQNPSRKHTNHVPVAIGCCRLYSWSAKSIVAISYGHCHVFMGAKCKAPQLHASFAWLSQPLGCRNVWEHLCCLRPTIKAETSTDWEKFFCLKASWWCFIQSSSFGTWADFGPSNQFKHINSYQIERDSSTQNHVVPKRLSKTNCWLAVWSHVSFTAEALWEGTQTILIGTSRTLERLQFPTVFWI